MAIVTAMIPAGFGPEKKARFISETKNALCEAFDLIPMAISLWVQEYEPENVASSYTPPKASPTNRKTRWDSSSTRFAATSLASRRGIPLLSSRSIPIPMCAPVVY